jgi:hypothetical protein
MKHLLLFESYISSISEMFLGDPGSPETHATSETPYSPAKEPAHYINRTSLDHRISRVVPHDENHPYGFKVDIFVDDKNRSYSLNVVKDALGIDEDTINSYISKTLNMLTNSDSIKNWNPPNDKFEQSIDLGRICFKLYDEKYYPVIQGGNGEGGFYRGGDNIWMIAKENKNAVTLKYYDRDANGKKRMYNASLHNAIKKYGKTYDEFIGSHSYGEPYGAKPEIVIDLTDDDEESIVMAKVKNQIENR